MTSRFDVSYDPDAQAAYIRVGSGQVVRTEEVLDDQAWMDFDAEGGITGIEVISIEPGELHDVLVAIEDAIDSIRERLGDERRQLLAL